MKKKIFIVLLLTVLLVSGTILVITLSKKDSECNQSALKFKQEYESYNNEKIKYNNKEYKLPKLTINKDNPMRKLNQDDLMKKLNKSTTVIMFTSPIDYTSREMIKVLLEISPSFDCESIYYYDIDEISDEIITEQLKEKLEQEQVQNGTIIFLQKGKITEIQIGITKDYKYGKKINEKQKIELSRKIKNGFNSISGGICERQQQC